MTDRIPQPPPPGPAPPVDPGHLRDVQPGPPQPPPPKPPPLVDPRNLGPGPPPIRDHPVVPLPTPQSVVGGSYGGGGAVRLPTPESVVRGRPTRGGGVHDAGEEQTFEQTFGFNPRELDDAFHQQGYLSWTGWRAAT
jgi:hypothetical protein